MLNSINKILKSIPKTSIVIVVLIGSLSLWVNKNNNSKSRCDKSEFLSFYTELVCDAANVILQNSEAIAILLAAIQYLAEIPDRKKQRNYEAWQVIDKASVATQVSAGIFTSYARKQALEDLCKDGVSLASIDMSRADLSGVKLNEANLCQANFQGANLSAVEFIGAKLLRANLSETILNGTKFFRADLRDVKFQHAATNFEGLYLNDDDLLKAKARKVDFRGANLRGADLSYTSFEDADFSGADLFGASLCNANLKGANFENAIVRNTDVKGANFSSAKNLKIKGQFEYANNFRDAIYDPAYKMQLEPTTDLN